MSSLKEARLSVEKLADFLQLPFPLREEQLQACASVLAGQDTFVVVPTGFGQSLIQQCLPLLASKVATNVQSVCLNFIVVVVSPLVALMQDQVARCRQSGWSALYWHGGFSPVEVTAAARGKYSLLFVSPETLVGKRDFHGLLSSRVFTQRLICIAIDEAHCVQTW